MLSGSAAELVAEGLRELGQATPPHNERAVALFEEAIRIDPSLPFAYTAMSKAYVQRARELGLGRHWLDAAITAGKRAVELEPSSGPAYLALGAAYRGQGKLREELDLWQRRVAIEPTDADATERIGWILWFTGHADRALPWLHKTVAQRPSGRWGHFYLGNANLALENHAEAESMYRQALGVHPDHSSAQAGVIWSLLAAREDDEARHELRIFQASTFDDDRYFIKVSDVEHFLGENENALPHARKASAEEPEERYWPRGNLPSTIVGAILWSADRAAAADALRLSEEIDRERLEGGDEGFMCHVDLAAVRAIRGDTSAACQSLRRAIAAGWGYKTLAARDPLFRSLQGHGGFQSILNGKDHPTE
jgi:tetratricopeptide (TPR) repeat protein